MCISILTQKFAVIESYGADTYNVYIEPRIAKPERDQVLVLSHKTLEVKWVAMWAQSSVCARPHLGINGEAH